MPSDIEQQILDGLSAQAPQALDALSTAMQGGKAKVFLSTDEGKRFVRNVNGLRDIYEASLLEGKPISEWTDYINSRYPEEAKRWNDLIEEQKIKGVPEGQSSARDDAKVWLRGMVDAIKRVHSKWPQLATSDNYVIQDNANGIPRYVPRTDENGHLPHTTGQYIQNVATSKSLSGSPTYKADLEEAIAGSRGIKEYPSSASNHPLLGSAIAPRTYQMWDDDELQSKRGGMTKSIVGDAMELGLNFVPGVGWFKGAKKVADVTGKVLEGVHLAKAGQAIEKVGTGIGRGVDGWQRFGEEGSNVGRAIARGAKGGVGNAVNAGAIEGLGTAYDALNGTDRGNGMNKEGLAIATGTGLFGRVLGNSVPEVAQRSDLWTKLIGTDDGRKLIKSKGWKNATDIDMPWLEHYVGTNTNSDFAQAVFQGKDYGRIQLDPNVSYARSHNMAIDPNTNAGIKQAQQDYDELLNYRKGIKQEAEDYANNLDVERADLGLTDNVATEEERLAKLKADNERVMNEDLQKNWEKMNNDVRNVETSQYLKQGTMDNYNVANAENLEKQNPYKERQPEIKTIKILGNDMSVITIDGKLYIKQGNNLIPANSGVADAGMAVERIRPDGSYNKPQRKTAEITDYKGQRGIPVKSAEDIGRERWIGSQEERVAKAKAERDASFKNLTDKTNKLNNTNVDAGWVDKRNPFLIPTGKKITADNPLQLRDSDGRLTSEASDYFHKNWNKLGTNYRSYEDFMRQPDASLQTWIDMENSHLTDGWYDKIGSGQWMEVPDYFHQRNVRGNAKQQSAVTKADKVANTTAENEYKLMGENWNLEKPKNTDALKRDLKEYADRTNYGKIAEGWKNKTPRGMQDNMVRGARATFGTWFIPTTGRLLAKDYQYDRIPEGINKHYIIQPNDNYELKPKKK